MGNSNGNVNSLGGFIGTLEGKASSALNTSGGAKGLAQNITHLDPKSNPKEQVSLSPLGLKASLNNSLSFNWDGHAHNLKTSAQLNVNDSRHGSFNMHNIFDGVDPSTFVDF